MKRPISTLDTTVVAHKARVESTMTPRRDGIKHASLLKPEYAG